MRPSRVHGVFHSHETSLENFKRRHALPAMPENSKFFDRILSVRKIQELVFITKNAAKDR